MQAQIAQIHETYQRCMNEQTNTTQRRWVMLNDQH
jgi:hypothetical protein